VSRFRLFCGPHPIILFIYIIIVVKVCFSTNYQLEMNSLLFSVSSSKLHMKCSHDSLSVGFNSWTNLILFRKQFRSHFKIHVKHLMDNWSSKDRHLVDFYLLFNTLSCTCSMILSVLAACGLWRHCASTTITLLRNLVTHFLMTCSEGTVWTWNIILKAPWANILEDPFLK
jgi:hypothetical protein